MAGDHDRHALLADNHYDNDATLVDSDSASDVDGADDRLSGEYGHVKETDRDILEETEEHERLLQKPGRSFLGLIGGEQHGDAPSKKTKKRGRRANTHRTRPSQDSDMFEMEGGFKDTSSQESSDSETKGTKWDRQLPAKKHRGRLAIVYLAIIALFIALVSGAYKASKKHILAPTHHRLINFSNGTHNFRPTTILISLDGFRADFLNRGITPALNAFIASGVSPKYMLPSFPSVTFPNHFTLVTGLYPESHGIVSNQFWDPIFGEEFYYTNVGVSMQPKWWTAEPIWVTAENQNVRTAIHMWPGSEAHIPDVEPTYLDKYNGSEALPRKVDRILNWLDLPGDDDDAAPDADKRPQLIAAYVPDVDADGHKYGPNSTEIRATIADVDSMLTMLVEGLYNRNLTEIVNIVIVSDHGMATTSTERLIQLDDLMDTSLIDHIDGWPLRGLRLKNPERDVPILYEQLSKEAEKAGTFDVYTPETMPERYHFSNNDRIAPLWIVPKTGWAVVEKPDFDVADALATGKEYEPKGLHGYDHEHPLMRAIFVARGPAFPHKANSRVEVFQNIEVYNIVCDALGMAPHPNNGTLRLPLKTVGLHSDFDAAGPETPSDPVDHDTEPNQVDDQDSGDKTSESTTQTDDTQEDVSDDQQGDSVEGKSSWWKFIHDGLEKAKEWAKQFVDSIKGNKEEGSDNVENAPSVSA
ncbi:ectonucleotide pyrophosphatase/phosphodiesterase family member 1/3 [Exophiala aquamarina CBS 119918]|uniref:Ectonucleotide pyrophosphatase/phosphodiesterase family member 1/3 n=1 Tax=Exophiala aquamarina CBS 119918 TaxID=1182545 RepID=A0A072PET3_9EURO|nr:ectonucleotide pyrophosphatase/phosphodiesterase family member 1/3 [Exophiala aquamarina CBS 119918]KEF58366.1 ectonucleotide pyrophosphatase/phosphodiesterase family member 1/3 [Exophiala aquamarina CBS 119918]